MAGLGMQSQNNVAAATTPIATAIKNNTAHRKLGLLNRGYACYGFDLVFVLGGVTSPLPPRGPNSVFL
jgi:hypothetical protein